MGACGVAVAVLSGYQANLLDMIYMGFPMYRDKFNMIMAEDIVPRCTAKEYCDREEKECELKQVIRWSTTAASSSQHGEQPLQQL